jgi:hypothetical protein
MFIVLAGGWTQRGTEKCIESATENERERAASEHKGGKGVTAKKRKRDKERGWSQESSIIQELSKIKRCVRSGSGKTNA